MYALVAARLIGGRDCHPSKEPRMTYSPMTTTRLPPPLALFEALSLDPASRGFHQYFSPGLSVVTGLSPTGNGPSKDATLFSDPHDPVLRAIVARHAHRRRLRLPGGIYRVGSGTGDCGALLPTRVRAPALNGRAPWCGGQLRRPEETGFV